MPRREPARRGRNDVSRGRNRATTRFVAALYSRSAGRVYDRVVLQTGLPLLARGLAEAALAQGRRAADAARGEPVLDMPVGTGYFTRAMAAHHAGLIVGCDIAWGMVATTSKSARREGFSSMVAVQADAHDLPFPDECFQVVVSTNGLQVIPGTEAAVSELVRVTRTGGRIFVAAVAAPASRLVPETARDRLPGFLRDPEEVVAMFQAAGVTVTPLERRRLGYLLEGTRFTS